MTEEGDRHNSGLVLRGISKTFSAGVGAVTALDDVTLAVERGQFVTLIGPSGCGKSTLLRIAAGLIEPSGGSVSVFGEEVASARRNKRIGYVPQSPALLPWRSVLDNVRFPLQVNRRRSTVGGRSPEELLVAMGLGDALRRRPDELSGGMQQRVAIARAFAFAPTLLLMDEPFSALDELTREALRHQLVELWQRDRRTVVFVTHSVTEAVVLSDTVVVMSGRPGRIHAVVPVGLDRPRQGELEDRSEVHAVEHELRRALRSAMSAAGPSR